MERAPRARTETIRQALLRELSTCPSTARELAGDLKIPERDVIHHLTHLARSLKRSSTVFHVEPAVCEECGFVFMKRSRLSTPGSCPLCRSRRVSPPLFSIEE